MIKVVVNNSFGGFGLSAEAIDWLTKNSESAAELVDPATGWVSYEHRHHPILVKCVEELGELANDEFAKLEIREIGSKKYRILEDEGHERVETPETIHWVEV